jgi:glycosyltransferase involved in cell wall biosynthesis
MTSDQPLVSVIIPAYNHGPFVGAAVESALGQTHSHLEVIVVDNYSSDNTATVLAGIQDERLRVFQFNNQGVIAAGRNFGAKQARGSILAFLDSDDVWMPEKLKTQLPHLADPTVRCVGTDSVTIGDTRYYRKRIFFGARAAYRDYTIEDIARRNPMVLSSSLIRASDFWEAGGFDECTDYVCIEDWALWLRLAQSGRIRVLTEPLIAYRAFLNKGRDRRPAAFGALKLLDKYSNLLSPSSLKQAYGSRYLEIGKACLKHNDMRAWKFLYKTIWMPVGVQDRISAIGGVFVCCTPHQIRRLCIDLYRYIPFVVRR